MWKIFNLTVPSVPVEKTVVDYNYEKFQQFGSDNLFPQHLAAINRQSPVHAGVLNNKTLYTIGKGFDPDLLPQVNPNESLRAVASKLVGDYWGFGNAYIEIVTTKGGKWVNLYHTDSTKCRVTYEGNGIIVHPKWADYASRNDKAVFLPYWPNFDEARDINGKEIPEYGGFLRSVYHYKDYSPEFSFYGIPGWISALNAAGIAYKTDKWNLSRLDNSFKTSGVLLLNGNVGEDEAKKMLDEFQSKMVGEGTQGKILFVIKQLGQDGSVSFTELGKQEEGDWIKLHEQSGSDIITAHNWFRSLSGIADNTGFDTKRILNEYEVAMNTVIAEMQKFILEPIVAIYKRFGKDISKMQFINSPPVSIMGLLDPERYVRIWEARKMAGMDFDENDEDQKKFMKDGTNDSRRGGNNGDQQ
jgi:hypothetical protein